MSESTSTRLHNAREAGLVSIMVTLVLMIVISLIVLGFAQISRRNQRQAVDRQLSTQAFYAAESGVNDVRQLIEAAVAGGQAVPAKESCEPGNGATATFYGSLNPIVNADANVEYTCIMVDPAPNVLLYGSVGSTSVIVPVISANGSAINAVNLVWQSKQTGTSPMNGCPGVVGGVFSPVGNWTCGYGVLRVDLVPTAGSFNYATLQNNTMTTFLVPVTTGGSSSVGYASNGTTNRIGASCTNASCTFSITGLSANQYYMRVSSVYRDVSMQVSATGSGGSSLELQGAQAVIDSTGKAQDVLRRVQVYVPLKPGSSTNLLSDYAIQSTGPICKRFTAMQNQAIDPQVNGVTSDNPLCQP